MKSVKFVLAIFAAVSILAASTSATELYSEAFNSVTANVTILQQPDTTTNFIDYSNFTVGAKSFSIPESPRMIAGSDAQRGILIRANKLDDVAGAQAVNVLAGNVPMSFSGSYRVSYDAYMSVTIIEDVDGSLHAPENGSTEQLLWGVGTGDSIIEARHTRFAGTKGTWGWLAGENGYGSEDAAIFEDGTELADLGDTQGPSLDWPNGENEPFNEAFEAPIVPGAPNNAPGNQWVEVDVDVLDGVVSVYFKGPTAANRVLFFSEASSAIEGAAMLGYEDPFSGVTSDPRDPNAADGMWGLFDNFRVTVIPEPSGGLICLMGLVVSALLRRKR